MKSLLRKILPKSIIQLYHFCLAIFAAIIYHFPSNRMIVVGVTGTGGKSTTVKMIGKILEENGSAVGWLSSLTLKTKDKEWANPYHMTMLGRFKLQKYLSEMVKNKIRYVIVEATSEGIKQFRHIGINFDILVFTNLSKEHIEAHGSFEKYRNEKLKIFKKLSKQKKKKLNWLEKSQEKIIIANIDDENADYFLNNEADKKIGFSVNEIKFATKNLEIIKTEFHKSDENGSMFKLGSVDFELKLLGSFNIYNALAAITTTTALGVDYSTSKKALLKIIDIPGRMEKIETNKEFNVVIDLAHTPDSLKQAYKTIRKSYSLVPGLKSMICVFGSAGGGRDKWKRPVMGKIAANYCDKIFLTNEDPYNENPEDIIKDIEKSVVEKGKKRNKDYYIIEDRQLAIANALKSANKGDLVMITGKGTEATMVIGDKHIPWNEKEVVQTELKKL